MFDSQKNIMKQKSKRLLPTGAWKPQINLGSGEMNDNLDFEK